MMQCSVCEKTWPWQRNTQNAPRMLQCCLQIFCNIVLQMYSLQRRKMRPQTFQPVCVCVELRGNKDGTGTHGDGIAVTTMLVDGVHWHANAQHTQVDMCR